MKNYCTTFILLFLFQVSFGQIGFEESVVMENILPSINVFFVENSDIDDDGDEDVIYIDNFGTYWFENVDGQNSDLIRRDITTTELINFLIPVDIDNDGDIDIVMRSSQELFLAVNIDGFGNFSDPQVIFNDFLYSFSVVDVDSDNDLDIVLSDYDSSSNTELKWLENIDGLGDFQENDIELYAGDIRSLVTGDVDGDGDVDILTYNIDDLIFECYVNDGYENFTAQEITDGYFNDLATLQLSDIDGDSDLDLIVTDSEGFSSSIEEFKILKNDGLGVFTEYQIVSTGLLEVYYAETNDMDGDGDLDILYASDDDNTASWIENIDGQGTFGSPQIINNNALNIKCVTGFDFDGDNDVDILTASPIEDKLSWYENLNNTGDFSSENVITRSINLPYKLLTADMDGDGDKDIVAACLLDQKITWYPNLDGFGEYGEQKHIAAGIQGLRYFAVDDLDGDGDMDVVTGESSGSTNDSMWYENTDGLGEAFQRHDIGGMSALQSIITGDMDGDGDKDLILSHYQSTGSSGNFYFRWRENLDSQGDFSTSHIIELNSSTKHIFYEDIDGNGIKDLLVPQNWYKNDGTGNLIRNDIEMGSYGMDGMYPADFDSDGDLDIVVVYEFDYISDNSLIGWFENTNGLGDFSEINIIDDNITDYSEGVRIDVYGKDMDDDGDQDIVFGTTYTIRWYENLDGLGTFSTEHMILNLTDDWPIESHTTFVDDINQDGYPDIIKSFVTDSYSYTYVDDVMLAYKNLSLQSNKIKGHIRVNQDFNSCNSDSAPVSNVMVVSGSDNDNLATFTYSNGYYQLFPEIGDYNTYPEYQFSEYFYFNPSSHESTFTDIGYTETANFCIESNQTVNDLNIAIYPSINNPRPGFDTTYQLVYKNVGTVQLSGSVTFEFDDTKLQFLNASEVVSSQTSNTLIFDYSDLSLFETRTIDLEFNVFAPPVTEIDDELVAIASVNPVSGDETENDNVFELQQTVIGSYDPNDITCLEGGQILIEDADKYLHYLIRFQNTGTASAINVRVENVLDDKLDWVTMQLESLSHTGRVEIVNGSEVSFIFNNINLPDSTNDEPNSHGYIAYKIKPIDNVVLGDIFYNTADIYFDFNPPIITNTVATEIVEEQLSVSEFENSEFIVFPNPTNSKLTIQSRVGIREISIVDVNGRLLNTLDHLDLSVDVEVDVENLSNGIYFLIIQAEHNKQVVRFIKN